MAKKKKSNYGKGQAAAQRTKSVAGAKRGGGKKGRGRAPKPK